MKIALIILLEFLISGTIWAGPPRPDLSSPLPDSYDEEEMAEATNASYVIFSNLDSKRGQRFNGSEFAAFSIAGDQARQTETWYAVRFSPTVDVQAKTLAAAIGYVSGTKLVTLGLYSNKEATNSVGDPLPGGQASTTRIPELGQCCQLTTVVLSGEGVFLSANEIYWLVVGPDNTSGPDFLGGWHLSNFGAHANFTNAWLYPDGQWPAAEIRGTPSEFLQTQDGRLAEANSSDQASTRTIFSNLARTSETRYLFGAGAPVYGKDVSFEPEIWQALPFTPQNDFHAKTLAAAIAWQSGTS